VADPSTVDPRFLLSEAKADALEAVIARHWPEQVDPSDLGDATLEKSVIAARRALLDELSLPELA